MTDTAARLARRLGTGDAVVVGLSAMLGAGVFAVWGPAAAAAGSGLLAGLAIAAVVAFCNATSSAQLAEQYPSSGGAYLFGREVLGPWWGFTAGWGFVIGKTASCAAMALVAAAYAVPGSSWAAHLVAALVVLALTGLNLRGITRTAAAARILLAVTGAVLVAFLLLGRTVASHGPANALSAGPGWYGTLQSAGLLFFAFAGYARIATLAEEVRRPQSLGRAILIALGVTIVVYTAVGATLISSLGDALPGSRTPLVDAVRAWHAGAMVPVVAVGATAAALGALLALLAGVARTVLAMARNRDLPAGLASVSPGRQVPDRAQAVIGVTVAGLVLLVDVRQAIGFSAVGVLVYYFVANAAAFCQGAQRRRWPRVVQVVGMLGCAVLVLTLPWTSVVAGIGVLAVGMIARLITGFVRGRDGR